jgi:penicillin-binding protein 1C
MTLRQKITSSAIAIGALAGIAFAAFHLALRVVEPAPLAMAETVSTTALDRHGRLLRAFTTPGGRWRLPVEPGDVDARYLKLLIAFEDRRFHTASIRAASSVLARSGCGTAASSPAARR